MVFLVRKNKHLGLICLLGFLLSSASTAAPAKNGPAPANPSKAIEPLSASSSWSAGQQTGSYDGVTFTWLPGRDAEGIITRKSVTLVPLRTWVRVAGTEMSRLEAKIKQKIPTWRELASWARYTRAWNGFAVDKEGNRAWFFGGGHADGSNNGLYRLDAVTLQWEIEALPSDPAKWDPDYAKMPPVTGSYTVYTETKKRWEQDRSEYSDIDNQGKPTARHTYRSMQFDPLNNQIIMWCRRVWSFDLQKKSWSVRFPYNRTFHQGEKYDAQAGYMGENIDSTFDEKGGVMIAGPTNNYGAGRFISWHPASGAFQDRTEIPGGYMARHGVMERRGRQWWQLTVPQDNSPNESIYWPIVFRIVDLDTKTVNAAPAVLERSITKDRFMTKRYDGISLTYIDDQDGFVLAIPDFLGKDGIRRIALLWVDAKTREISWFDFQRGAWPDRPFHVIERNMFYLPKLGLLVHLDSGEAPLYVMRLR